MGSSTRKATVRGGAPYLWAVVLMVIQDAIGLDLIQWVNEATGIRESYIIAVGIWVTGLLLNVWAMVQNDPRIELLLKFMPGAPEYASNGVSLGRGQDPQAMFGDALARTEHSDE